MSKYNDSHTRCESICRNILFELKTSAKVDYSIRDVCTKMFYSIDFLLPTDNEVLVSDMNKCGHAITDFVSEVKYVEN